MNTPLEKLFNIVNSLNEKSFDSFSGSFYREKIKVYKNPDKKDFDKMYSNHKSILAIILVDGSVLAWSMSSGTLYEVVLKYDIKYFISVQITDNKIKNIFGKNYSKEIDHNKCIEAIKSNKYLKDFLTAY